MAFNNMSSGIGQRFTTDQFASWNTQPGIGRKTTGGDLSPGSRKNLGGMPPQPPGQQPQIQQPPPLQQFGQQRQKKTGLFGEDEDSETSLYFSQSNLFRPDREMMSSNSPSQLTSSFGNPNFYTQGLTGSAGLNSSSLGMTNLGVSSSLGGSSLGGTSISGSAFGSTAGSTFGISSGSISGTSGGSSSIVGSSIGGSTSLSSNFSALPQRSNMSGPQFRGNNATPTNMNPNLPFNLQQPQQQPSPNRNISAIGGQRSSMTQNQQNMSMSKLQNSGPMNSLSNTYGFGSSRQIFGADENQPGLDLSEFPTLGNRNNLPNNPLPSAARNYGQYRTFGMVSKPVTESTPEFQIQQEDFPALPGAQNPPSSSASDSSRKTPTSSASTLYDNALGKDGKFPGDKSSGQTKRGIQTSPEGTVSNIPSGMVTDQFGIVGLLTFIRAAENDPNLVALAPGIDLTTLGLNLNSPENLYSTFQSPWADSPCRPQDIDFHVPSEYLTNIFIREKLAPIKLNRYGEDLLFFLFYMNGSDVIQLAAAAELYTRDWRYHKEERVWITRAPGVEPAMKTNTYERGTYYFFDAQSWRKVAKEFFLEYDKLEERPSMPPTIHHNANQSVLAH